MTVSKLVPSETRILQAWDGACVTTGKTWGDLAATISGIEFMPHLDDGSLTGEAEKREGGRSRVSPGLGVGG
jgi:hypothetical protein